MSPLYAYESKEEISTILDRAEQTIFELSQKYLKEDNFKLLNHYYIM